MNCIFQSQSLSPTSPVPGEDLSTAPVSENGSFASSPSVTKPGEPEQKKINIGRKSHSWYSPLCNRWVSFFGVTLKLIKRTQISR